MTTPGINTPPGERLTPTSSSLRERDDRLEALKVLAGHLAHDFNNFLAPILGYLTLIKEEAAPGSTILQYADAMETSARRTERAVESILVASRPQRNFHIEETDFAGLIDEELKLWQDQLPSTAKINVVSHLEPCTLSLDRALWRNAIQQVFRNARFALATGGEMAVELRPISLTPMALAELGLASQKVYQFSVRDNGFGMSEAVRRQAFDPFFTTRPKGQALGLGLSIVHSVVRAHGGQVALDSQEDRGTCITIWMPAETTIKSGADSPAAPAKAAQRGIGKKILLVDDDPMVREVLRTCLHRAKLDVFVAKDGVDGMAAYKRYAKELGLIITDISMPHMDGVELARQIRELNPDLPLILVSGDAETHVDELLAKLGDKRPMVMKKPFAVKGLIAEVMRILG